MVYAVKFAIRTRRRGDKGGKPGGIINSVPTAAELLLVLKHQ